MKVFYTLLLAFAAADLAEAQVVGAKPVGAFPLVVRTNDSAGVIRGVVRDSAGRAIPLAAVIVAGTRNHAFVDSAGYFRLSVPSGRLALVTRALGFDRRTDSLTVTTRGFDIEITLRRSEPQLEAVCACDPLPALTLVFHRPHDAAIPFILITTRHSGRPAQRDSIPNPLFAGDTLSIVALWRMPGDPPGPVAVQVDVPGFRAWRRELVSLPMTLLVALDGGPATTRSSPE